jgi:hypothetical protein
MLNLCVRETAKAMFLMSYACLSLLLVALTPTDPDVCVNCIYCLMCYEHGEHAAGDSLVV